MSDLNDGLINTRSTLSGRTQRVSLDQYEVQKDYLEVVPDDALPYEPGLFKPGKVDEFAPPADAPATESVAAAQEAHDAVLADGHAPNSKAAREAKAALDEAEAAAQAETEAALAAAQNGEAGAAAPEGAN